MRRGERKINKSQENQKQISTNKNSLVPNLIEIRIYKLRAGFFEEGTVWE